MQKLADYIGLPCRIARGCKYCVADHRSSCLVKIEDRQLVRFDTFDYFSCLVFYGFVKTSPVHNIWFAFYFILNMEMQCNLMLEFTYSMLSK